jgi:hypothetical protein
MPGALQPALRLAAADLVFGRDRDLAAGDQAGLGGGAAHVERDQVGEAELRPGDARRDNPGGRAALDRHRRHAQPLRDVEHAAARPHDVKRRQPELGSGALQPAEIGGEQRSDIGADAGRAETLELADLRQDLAGEIDADPGQSSPQLFAEPALVGVVEERKQQADGDGVEFGRADRRRQTVDLVLGERRHDLALGADPLGDLEPPAPGHQYVRRVLQQIVEIGPRRAAQFEQIAKTARGHQAGTGALLLEQGVSDNCRRVRQQRDATRDPFAFEPRAKPRDHGAAEIVGRRQQLDDADMAARLVDQRDVGECAADIDADPPSAPMIGQLSHPFRHDRAGSLVSPVHGSNETAVQPEGRWISTRCARRPSRQHRGRFTTGSGSCRATTATNGRRNTAVSSRSCASDLGWT